jgi:hypothetical protein
MKYSIDLTGKVSVDIQKEEVKGDLGSGKVHLRAGKSWDSICKH